MRSLHENIVKCFLEDFEEMNPNWPKITYEIEEYDNKIILILYLHDIFKITIRIDRFYMSKNIIDELIEGINILYEKLVDYILMKIIHPLEI